jgi:ABC-type branched-subunit amino acid transport system permease subunit
LGGIGTLSGPIIGTLVFFGIPELFRVAQLYRLVILGAVIIVGVLFMPQGISGLIRQRLKRWTRDVGMAPPEAMKR